ncbi:hypothetical protein M407DRAFT_241902 [Tulasnella calospora MUT 4182]|uniref:Uncharacterized protein n=1 Tax=Tulasnella calospora MUT 4182 TaxID=1051891 RepID=A0A0C3QRA8_9AGAM|nr:hypothetical protein M407DRAFT_241902 [Tulasnella calospora MUT 4182]
MTSRSPSSPTHLSIQEAGSGVIRVSSMSFDVVAPQPLVVPDAHKVQILHHEHCYTREKSFS